MSITSTYTIADLRTLVRNSATNAMDSSQYSPFQVDLAIQGAADDLIRRTRFTKTITTANTVAGTATGTVSATGFEPWRVLSAYLTGANVVVQWQSPIGISQYYSEGAPDVGLSEQTVDLKVTTYESVHNISTGTNQTGQPAMIGFSTPSAYTVFPTPDAVYTVNIRWCEPFTSWTPGTVSDTGTVNLPDYVLRELCATGAVLRLQGLEPDYQRVMQGVEQRWERFVQSLAAQAGLGIKVLHGLQRVR